MRFIIFLIIFINFQLYYAVQLLNNERTSSENQLEAQIYTIQVPVKFSDGGDIWMIQDFEGPNGFKARKNETVNIEDVLKAVNGIDVEYIDPNKEDNQFVPNVEKSGQILFKQDIDIKGGGKRLRKLKGDKMYIWDFAHKMRRIDNRWMITGEKPKSKHIFRFLFDGHAMLTLLNNNEKEIARFHFNRQGLNLFRKEKGNVIVNQQDLSEKIDTTSLKRFRGQYIKNGFNPPLYSRKITIEEAKRIAHNVIGGRPWGGQDGFKCHHFVYSLAQALTEEENLNKLTDYWKWPTSLRLLDERINRLDGTFAFFKSVPLINYNNNENQKTNKEQLNKYEILKQLCISQSKEILTFPLQQCNEINKKFNQINYSSSKRLSSKNYFKITKPNLNTTNSIVKINNPIFKTPFLPHYNTPKFLTFK